MVVAVRVSPPVKGKVPKLNMLELVSVANKSYKTSKLRRRLIPQGYCYVCSRLDPSGIFRKPNGHLYKAGFLHSCEHFPKAPYTTFVQEEIPIQDDDGGDSLADFALDKTETIRVTIRRGSRSTGSRSTLKTEDKFEHSLNKFDEDQQSSAESLFKEKLSDFSTGKFRLPPLNKGIEGGLSARSETNKRTARKLSIFRKSSGAQTGFSGQLMLQTDSLHIGSEPNTTRDYITTKPPDSNRTSANLIGLFTEDEGTSKSARTADLDSLFASSGRPLTKNQYSASTNSGLKYPVTHGLFINQSDGLENAFTTEPLIRDEIMIDEIREPARRLKAKFQRERKLPERHAPSEHSASTNRPDSGHLRYHHRMTEDSVPDPGFEIPPTPSGDTPDIEKLKLEQEDEFDGKTGKHAIKGDVGGEEKINRSASEKKDIPSNLTGIPSESRSFCRCATDIREMSFTRDACRTCGKDCKLRNSLSRGSSQTYSQSGTSAMTTRSGRFRPTKLHMSKEDEMAMYRMNARTRGAAKNNGYLDIHEYDDESWSSDEEFADFDNSPVSWLRNSKPYPLVNPDIHKQVYIDALHAAKMKGKNNIEDFEIDELKMLRRPNVFSYIPLLPYEDKQKIRYIGIRPDDSSKPKKGQYMKHIFGDVRPDDFYPVVKPSKGGKIVIDDLVNPSSTEYTSSKERQVPATSRGPESSSISLKMKSTGITLDNEG